MGEISMEYGWNMGKKWVEYKWFMGKLNMVGI